MLIRNRMLTLKHFNQRNLKGNVLIIEARYYHVLKNGGTFKWYSPTIGAKHRVYGKIVKDVWEKFVSNGS